MPLVVLAGQPASGKTGVAARLAAALAAAQQHVLVVDEPGLHLERNAAYSSSAAEKAARGALRSAVERGVSKRTVVILDSLNNIKGYRYELWCVARSAGTRYAVLHVATPADTCAAWNAARPEHERYDDDVFTDLARRFETPDARNRWDAPLFTLLPGAPDEPAILAAVVEAATGAPPARPAAAPADGEAGPQLLHQGAMAGELRPTLATSNPALLGTNLLHELDRAVQDVVGRLMEAQQLAPGGGAGGCRADLGPAGQLELRRLVTLAELRRHKRAFLRLATKIPFGRLTDPAAAQRLFADHLRQQLAGADAG
ncbi:KTI12 [Scenedesmus sp. PABB004]|nr:KTI12 [Scenedesmus sp. PABB004]